MAYRVNTQKSNVFLYASNGQLEIKILKDSIKNIKYLEINLTKKCVIPELWNLQNTREKLKNIKRNADVYHVYGLGN